MRVQEVRRDPQRRERTGRTRRHGEVQPLHVVQACVRQAHVEGGRGRGGVAEGQVRRVHGRVRLLVQQLRLQLVHQALRARVRLWRRVGQRALQERLQLIVRGQRGQAEQRGVVHGGGQGGGRGHLDVGGRPGDGGADRQGGDVSCDREGLRERCRGVLLDKWCYF